MNRQLIGVFILVFGFIACEDVTRAQKGSAAPTADAQTVKPTATPSTLKTKTIKLGSQTLTIEIADTDDSRNYGLMLREHLDENRGMLFVFSQEEPLSFWMKNTLIPLAIAYINAKGKIVDIQEMVPASPVERYPKTYPSRAPAQYALEVNKGWFARHKIKVGDAVPVR